MRHAVVLILWIVTIGWLGPAFISATSYFEYERSVVQEFIWRGHAGGDSFPHLAFAWSTFKIAFIWFSVVAGGWTYYFIHRVLLPRGERKKNA